MKNIHVHIPVRYTNGVENGKTLEQIDAEIAKHTMPNLPSTEDISFEEKSDILEETVVVVKKSFCEKWKTDKVYRAKFLHTLCLFWSFVNLGWIIGQFGPSFLDLQIITRTRLEEGSAFMTAHSVGYLVGSLASGILFDRFNKIMLIFTAVFGNAVTVAIIPWCSRYELMIFIHLIKGVFSGSLDAVGNAELVYIWGDTGRSFMQTLHFCFAFGGILSPLATAPFLAPKREPRIITSVSNMTDNVVNSSLSPFNIVKTSAIDNALKDINYTNSAHNSPISYTNGYSNISLYLNETLSKTIEEVKWVKPQHSMIYVAYLISSGLALSAALPFLVTYCRSKKSNFSPIPQKPANKNEREMTSTSRCLMLLNMCVLIGTYSAIEDTFAGFLTTFCVEQMDWTKTQGSFATSIYWASFGLGRFIGILLVKFCSPVRMITMYCSLLIVSFIGLFFTSYAYYHGGIWICSSLAGLAMSIIFPTIFTWTEAEVLRVTGKVASLFLIGSSSGTMVNPIILGFLMDELTPMWFCYLLLGESVMLLILFVSALLLSKYIKNAQYTAYRDVVVEIKDEEEEPADVASLLDEDLDLEDMTNEIKGTDLDGIAFADEEKKKSYEQLNNNDS
ncbi:MFS transporter, FHS family, Na+ dependent glucose transporter 1 [Mytilus galloprovincialis]|uniref:MFS transporter, FHS family, Na+ dependent glucose transporter 1 n=1 Tax=Mytilus galloprovincialis TaxID=29158 RepID=A0A8B6H210_MYTGA|nr:MFS transporter, FHS family, Na+ dependent glucose transporter 1 [Mytilus galloprovincialis]